MTGKGVNVKHLCCVLLIGAVAALARADESPWSKQEAAALAAVDEYIDAFNARDARRFVNALHYPHMRVDGLGRPAFWATAADYLRDVEFDSAIRTGWVYSRYDWKRVVQSGRHKVHVLVSFTRYGADDFPLHTQESLYVVTEHDGRWAIQVRSSFLEQVQADEGFR